MSGSIEQGLMMPTLNRRLSRESYMGRSCVCEKALQPYATDGFERRRRGWRRTGKLKPVETANLYRFRNICFSSKTMN